MRNIDRFSTSPIGMRFLGMMEKSRARTEPQNNGHRAEIEMLIDIVLDLNEKMDYLCLPWWKRIWIRFK